MQKKIALLLDNTGSMSKYRETVKSFLRDLDNLLKRKNASYYSKNFANGLDSRSYTNPEDHRVSYHAAGGPTWVSISLQNFLSELSPQNGFEPTDKVIGILITDGQDEQTIESRFREIKTQIELMEGTFHWDWLFIGTDAQALQYSAKLGMKPGKTLRLTDTSSGFEAALNSLRGILDNWLDDKISGDDFFSEEDRQKQAEAGKLDYKFATL